MRLNLGCGRKYLKGYINCDFIRSVKAEHYFDLEVFPYPFESNFADEILLDNVLEHLQDVTRTMEEMHRVLKPAGLLRVFVPYAKSDWALQDPTHKHFFTEKSMDYFKPAGEYNFYSKARFEIRQAKLTCDRTSLRHKLRNAIPLRRVLRYFLYNLYDGVYFELEKVE